MVFVWFCRAFLWLLNGFCAGFMGFLFVGDFTVLALLLGNMFDVF